MKKHTTIAYFDPRDAIMLNDMDILGRWRGKMGAFSRRFSFCLDGDRWRQLFAIDFVASKSSRHDGEPMMMTQAFLEDSAGILAYGEPTHRYDMGWKGALYKEHWVRDQDEVVVLDLRAPTQEQIEMIQLHDKFAAVCPP